ncbi:hypothetical protein ED733_007461 [Metarhizium rileyi]|uniref:Uncharacterized protein n=1 Tax=Metarhizium rileyi (strain RCEF 4871) TaxID=1649241 RepID=A0A5C6GJM2_METRR|nr:hypothetical protein ED733_007461 [Metarhizium rileyi]
MKASLVIVSSLASFALALPSAPREEETLGLSKRQVLYPSEGWGDDNESPNGDLVAEVANELQEHDRDVSDELHNYCRDRAIQGTHACLAEGRKCKRNQIWVYHICVAVAPKYGQSISCRNPGYTRSEESERRGNIIAKDYELAMQGNCMNWDFTKPPTEECVQRSRDGERDCKKLWNQTTQDSEADSYADLGFLPLRDSRNY